MLSNLLFQNNSKSSKNEIQQKQKIRVRYHKEPVKP